MRKLLLQYKHALIWIAYIIFYILGYLVVEHIVTDEYHVIYMKLDDMIPFCEPFVLPYVLWFPYMVGTVLFLLVTDTKEYYKNFIVLAFGMTLFLIVSFLYPNGHNLRPEVMPRDNIFTWLVSFLYKADTSTNILPSIHVYDSLMAHAAIMHSSYLSKHQTVHIGRKLRNGDRSRKVGFSLHTKWIRLASFILSISITLSTVFIKQHSMVDVITGTALAAVMYVIFYIFDCPQRRTRRKANKAV